MYFFSTNNSCALSLAQAGVNITTTAKLPNPGKINDSNQILDSVLSANVTLASDMIYPLLLKEMTLNQSISDQNRVISNVENMQSARNVLVRYGYFFNTCIPENKHS